MTSLSSFAQKRGEYMYPINPNQTNSLSGGMAELRSNHFHMGIDVRTNNQIGLPVHAAADGYVARVKVKATGYGNAIYIKHKNGTTTLYGHLSKFNDKIAAYVRKIQYQRESFAVDLYLSPKQFPVKKGEIVALSGNSGSSGGPHVHFEIRDASERALNPLDYGFDEIKDNIAPIMDRVAFIPLEKNTLIQGEHNREIVGATSRGKDKYALRIPKIKAYGLIGLEIDAKDKADGVYFSYGMDEIEVFVNEKQTFKAHFDRISFANQRHMNNYINYEYYAKTRKRYRRCYVPDGANNLHFYAASKNKGKIFIEDGKTYKVRIRMTDAYGNESNTEFEIVGDKNQKVTKNYPVKLNEYEIQNNYMIFNAITSEKNQEAEVCVDYLSYKLQPQFEVGSTGTFFWDLRTGLPDSLILPNGTTIYPNIEAQIPSKTGFSFYHSDFDIYFPNGALYDTTYLAFKTKDNYLKTEDFLIGHSDLALQKYVTIKLKPENVSSIQNKSKVRAYAVYGNSLSFVGGTWKGDIFEFKTRNLGTFRLVEDTEKPNIRVTKKNNQQIICKISDSRSGIDSFRATINGKWLLMNYDKKRASLTSEMSDTMENLKGEFVLTVTDNVGNQETYKTTVY
ncbi:M23 family metallopeptidase [Bernardetia sp.]|uniref:M23 family metallopeptidase n=1 Tax=Bernardetia sp. TaxID=1937974 RepID=UPI0025BB1AEA|nr:M23 family metallopeptidase [Bernardetia sp.]